MPPLGIPESFEKRLRKRTAEQAGRILECVNQLGENPRHPGLHTHKVRGTPGVWEAYVDKANRVTFEWDGEMIRLRNHCNHAMLERNP